MEKQQKDLYLLNRKIVVCLVITIILTGMIAWTFMKNAHAYDAFTSTESRTYPNGYGDVIIKGPLGQEKINLTFGYSGSKMTQGQFNNGPHDVTIKRRDGEAKGVYQAEVANQTVKTSVNSQGNYSRIKFKITYWQSAHEEYASESYDAVPELGSQYTKASSDFKSRSGHSSSGRRVTVTVNMSVYAVGICTYSRGGKYHRIENTAAYLNLQKQKYTVNYKGNGGTTASPSKSFLCGSKLTFPMASRTGYTLMGWKSNADGTGTSYTTNSTICGKNLTAYAQWKANQYKIHYDANGGTGSMNDSTVTYNGKFTFPKSTFSNSGYHFLGWSKTKESDVADYDDEEIITYKTDSDLTLYAVWGNGQYKVSYLPNGAEGEQKVMAVLTGETIKLEKNTYQRPGYMFIGWNIDPDATKGSYRDQQEIKDLTDAGKTVKLYAIWKKSDGSFNTINIIHDEDMFTGDIEIEGGNGTGYDSGHTDSGYARIDQENIPGYFTKR